MVIYTYCFVFSPITMSCSLYLFVSYAWRTFGLTTPSGWTLSTAVRKTQWIAVSVFAVICGIVLPFCLPPCLALNRHLMNLHWTEREGMLLDMSTATGMPRKSHPLAYILPAVWKVVSCVWLSVRTWVMSTYSFSEDHPLLEWVSESLVCQQRGFPDC